MYKTDVINKVSETTKIKIHDVDVIYNAIINVIKEELYDGNEVVLTGFGAFKVGDRKERKGINPRNGDIIQIAPRKVVTFKPSNSFKSYINNKK